MNDKREYYEFTWPGKRQARIEAGKPAIGALRPCPELSKNFEATENLYIEGDNLEVLKLLRNSYMHKVKMIYIDPPYNTGHDFIYKDSFAQDGEEAADDFGLFSDEGEMYFTREYYRENTKSNPRYHSDWCSMIYPRLKVAKDLLRDDGVIFISIDDNEQANLRKICDELFGENNFVAQVVWKGRGGRQDSKYYAVIHEYILCYAKNIAKFSAGEEAKAGDSYPRYDERKQRYYKTQLLRKWGSNSRREDRPNLYYPITAPDGSEIYPMLPEGRKGCWRWGKDTMKQAIDDGRVEFVKQENGSWIAYEKIFAPMEGEARTKKYTTWIDDIANGTETLKQLFGYAPFDYSKSPELITHLMKMANVKEDAIILDFFSGSATTAHAVMALNHEDLSASGGQAGTRKFIMVQLPEECSPNSEARKAGYMTICDIGRERIRRAGRDLSGDTGFRCLRLDSSNFRDVYVLPEELSVEMLDDMVENIKPDRTGADLLFYAVSEFGLPLSLSYREEKITGFTVYVYGDGEIIACFEECITKEVVIEMANMKPLRIVFRDSCFADGAAKINAIQLVKGYAPDSVIRIL